jgi:CHASE2 domain-containing sensor protein
MIQTPEFWVYDAMVQRRPLELQDQRILLVTIDENDVAYQDRQGWQRIPTADGGLNSVAPEALAKLQERLTTLKPRVIGVDIYYPWPLTSAWQKRLWSNPRVVGLCKLADPTESVVEIPAPVGLKRDRVGFSDQADDSEGVVRRQLLAMAAPKSSQTCHTTYGLSGLVVDEYLKQRGVAILAVGNRWQYGSVTIPQITAGAGGYGWFDDQGNQLLLAPRRADWVRLPLREVLQSTDRIPWTGQPNPIVLIGNIQASSEDRWKLPGGQEIPGLEIQAHGISQLISAVLDNRPLLQAIAWPQKALWILLWAVLGAGLLAVWQARSPQPRWYDRLWVWAFGSLMVGAIGMISFFWAAWWLPVVSPMVAIGLVLLPLPGRKGRSQFSRWLGLVRRLPRRLLKSS